MKDSSGDWNNTKAMIDAFGKQGFDVFAGSEVFLLRTMRAGGVGCITAGANVNPHGIDKVYRAWQSAEAETLQATADKVRGILQAQVSMIPALKATIAHYADDADWLTVRPPLVELTLGERAKLGASSPAPASTCPASRADAATRRAVAGTGQLDLEDLGAVVGEERCGRGRGDDRRDVEDAETFERSAHSPRSSGRSCRIRFAPLRTAAPTGARPHRQA